MKDLGIFSIYSDVTEEIFKDFDTVMEDIYEDDSPESISTVIFSRYYNYSIITEVLYIIKSEGNLIFLSYPGSYELLLDKKLNPVDFKWGESQTFDKIALSTDSAVEISPISDSFGNLFIVCAINETDDIKNVTTWIENKSDSIIDKIIISDDIISEISHDYLNIRTEKFKNRMIEVINSGVPYDGMNENPFVDMFYNTEDYIV